MIKSRIWPVMLGFDCNNNCIMCNVHSGDGFSSSRSTSEIINDLKEGRELGHDRVYFTGGEPTSRPDIVDLMKFARNLGYKIGLNTNGRMLSYGDFCKEIIQSGVDSINCTLNGHNKNLADAISRTPGSFEQTVTGINNVLAYHQVKICVRTVVTRMNYEHLGEIGQLVGKLGVGEWQLVDLIPSGNAQRLYEALCVNALRLSEILNSLGNAAKALKGVAFYDFPLCFFSQEMLNLPKNIFITTRARMENMEIGGVRLSAVKDGLYEDRYRKQIDFCRKCQFSGACRGFWRCYLDLYGDQELNSLIEKSISISQKDVGMVKLKDYDE